MTATRDTESAHSDEAERIVLGSLMLQPGTADDVTAIIRASDFYRPAHSAIFAAITANVGLGEPADPAAIAVTLDRFGELQRVGGADYLHTCVAAVPVIASVTWYARQVAERAFARRAEESATRLQQVARKGDRSAIATALEQLQLDLAAAPGQDGAVWRSRLTNGAAFIYDMPDKVAAVWGDGDDVLWAAGEALMICGPQGVGKTTIGGQIVMARLGLTTEVLGWPVTPGSRRLLYLAMDRPQQAARSLGRIVRPEWRDVLQERLVVWQGPPPADFAAEPTLLMEMCRAADADTVVIDSVKDAAIGLSKDEVGAGYNRARQTAIAAGVEVLELHHQRKTGDGGGKPNSLSDVYGSTWIPSGAGSVLLLWGQAGDPVVELLHVKQPRNDVGPLTVIHDHDSGRSSIDTGDITRDLIYIASREPSGLTVQRAANALFGQAESNDVEKARRKLDGLVRKGLMVTREGEPTTRGGKAPKVYFAAELRAEERP
jgi:replicative DNA helicase